LTSPIGRETAFTTTGGAITIENACEAEVTPALSLTVTLKLNGLPAAFVGVPPIVPVPGFSVNPAGNDPALTDQLLYEPEPPEAASVAWYETPTSPAGNGELVTAKTPVTEIVNPCATDTLPALSFVVTLNPNGVPTALVGVPLMTPVTAFNVTPGGSVPALTVQLP
jgi:hypothetical protein